MAGSQTFRASVICEGPTGTAIVFDYSYADSNLSPAHVDTGTAAGVFQTLVQATLAAALPDNVTFKKYRFATVTGPYAGEVGYVVVDPPVTGDLVATDILPTEIAISMKRNTGHTGRGDRGRVFFGPVHKDFQSTTNPDKVEPSADLTAIAALGNAVLTTAGPVLDPVLLNSAGVWNGHVITNTSVGDVFVHRRTRRFRAGT